ncbi:MAG: flavodoxin family protein [Chlorobi bacterium]|nr:flavodoxin family protein [Chlorobiota bacterium]
MKKVLTFNGSPRKTGNTTALLKQFLRGVEEGSVIIKEIDPYEINLQYCRGCLRCNLLKRCSVQTDDWTGISREILESDILVFATPVYFRHVTAPLKKIIDRFRSFVHVQITETGLIHTPWEKWNKDFVLLLTMGSSDKSEADGIIDLFRFMTGMLGDNNHLHVITATRLAVTRQVERTREELQKLYPRLMLPEELAEKDAEQNRIWLEACYRLGKELAKRS